MVVQCSFLPHGPVCPGFPYLFNTRAISLGPCSRGSEIPIYRFQKTNIPQTVSNIQYTNFESTTYCQTEIWILNPALFEIWILNPAPVWNLNPESQTPLFQGPIQIPPSRSSWKTSTLLLAKTKKGNPLSANCKLFPRAWKKTFTP